MADENKQDDEMVDEAIVPLNLVTEADLKAGANRFDEWLQRISGGHITLSRVKTIAGSLPIMGNIMAAIDTIIDLIEIIQKKVVDKFDWLGLGANVLGILPLPPGTAAIRMTARPVIQALKQSLRNNKEQISMALVTVIVDHVENKGRGSIDNFIVSLKGLITSFIDGMANLAEKFLNELVIIFESVINAEIFDVDKSFERASQNAEDISSRSWYNPWNVVDGIAFVGNLATSTVKRATNFGVDKAIPVSVKDTLKDTVNTLKTKIPLVKEKIRGLNTEEVGGILWTLTSLAIALQQWRKRGNGHVNASVSTQKKSQATNNKRGDDVENRRTEEAANNRANPCSTATGRSKHSIDFAIGEETFSHIDFELPGVMPLVWSRLYSSRLSAYDQGPLGARWLNPFTLCIQIEEGGKWTRYGQDGRPIALDALQVGQAYRHPIEGFTALRLSEEMLTLTYGKQLIEVYELHGKQFRLALRKDRVGNAMTLHYEGEHLSLITDTQGQHLHFSHDEQGRFTRIELYKQGEAPRVLAQYDYDVHGDLVKATNEAGEHWQYTYHKHLITRYTDKTGRGMNLEWDGEDPKAKCIREYADDGSYDTKLAWNPNIRQTVVRDALNHATSYFYDIDGYTYRVIYPDRTEEWFFRDEHKNVIKHVHPDGSKDMYAYDERDNMIEHVARDGSVKYFEYDAEDQLITITDEEGYKWHRKYDDKGNLVSETDPKNNVTKYTYNELGLPVSVIDAKGGTKTLAWRPDGQIQSHTDCSGKTTQWTYNKQGLVTSVQDAMGNTTHYAYDKRGYINQIITPDGQQQTLEHDAEGRLLKHANARAQETIYDYDVTGRVIKRTDPMHHRVSYAYDKNGRLTRLTDANGTHYTFTYDAMGRVITEQGFDGKRTNYRYEDGQLSEMQEAGAITKFTFDLAGRLIERASGLEVETFDYGPRGQLLVATTNHTKLQWFYDAVGNLEKEYQEYKFGETSKTYVWRHEYDELGNRMTTLRPDGQRIDWLRYGSGHVHGMMLNLQEFASFERDDLHRESKRYLLNRLEQQTQYDAVGRILQQNITGKSKQQRLYQYDDIGQLVGITDSSKGVSSYTYDPIGRLLRASTPKHTETFAFDPAGNILSAAENELDDISQSKAHPSHKGAARTQSHFAAKTGSKGKVTLHPLMGNLLKSFAGTHYEYDERGNLIKKTHNGEVTEYIWDNFNRLRNVKTKDSQNLYYYDALGRRIAKEQVRSERSFDAKGNIKPIKQDTIYLWDQDVLAIETVEDTSTHYVFEPHSFKPFAQFKTAAVQGIDTPVYDPHEYRHYDPQLDPLNQYPTPPQVQPEIYYIHTDHLGTPQEMSDASGEMVWQAQYKAWGQAQEVIKKAARSAGQDTDISCPFRFQGQYFDEESGLHYNRHRYYDPEVGRFISSDPIRLSGGNNLYAYAPNPLLWIDPLGLKPVWDPCKNSFVDSSTGQTMTQAQAAQQIEIHEQKQAGHIQGTPQYNNRVKQGTDTSAFDNKADADRYVRETIATGTPVPNRPGVFDKDYGSQRVGTGPKGGTQTRVRAHVNSKGQGHGHPVGRET